MKTTQVNTRVIVRKTETFKAIPLKTSKKKPLTKEEQDYNTWHSKLRIGVEHGIGRMKKFNIFADIYRNNRQQNMIAKNVGALANMNLITV